MTNVFVYGSLKHGQERFWVLDTFNAKYLGDHTLNGYTIKLVVEGGFPALIEAENEKAFGEIYEANDELMAFLDQIEGVSNHLFERFEVEDLTAYRLTASTLKTVTLSDTGVIMYDGSVAVWNGNIWRYY